MRKKKNLVSFSAAPSSSAARSGGGGGGGNALSLVIFVVLSIIVKINIVDAIDALDGTGGTDGIDDHRGHGQHGIISNLEYIEVEPEVEVGIDPDIDHEFDRSIDIDNGLNIGIGIDIDIDIDIGSYEDSCYSHPNCTSCTEASVFCHWCDFDSKCHAKGSIHGCAIGGTCDANATAAPTPSPSTPPPYQDDSCNAHTDCTTCITSSIFCHWCDFDSQCHTKGSIHGCAMGATCQDDHNHDKDKDKDNNKCSSHKSCTECTLASKTCHWCAFDDGCHVIGSWYGCTHGVNCFNNDRCKRLEPEKIDYTADAEAGDGDEVGIGFWSMAIIIFVGSVCCCCSSLCFITVRAVKGAYDDWATVNYDHVNRRAGSGNANRVGNGSNENDIHIDIENSTPYSLITDNNLTNIEEEEEVEVAAGEEGGKAHIEKEVENGNGGNNNHDENEPLLPSGSSGSDNGNFDNAESNVDGDNACDTDVQFTDNPTSSSTATARTLPLNVPLHSSISMSGIDRLPTQPTSSHQVKCLYNTCLIWYILSLAAASIFTFGAIYYFPKIPEFNVCSDEFAWNSIIDSLTSLKVEASFEVLASVKNTNHLHITMDNVGGSFRHNGEDIGTFSMPTTTIAADSITDLLVTCSVRPDKWEALGLISDYYRGKLEFLIDVSGNAKIKGIGYSIPVSVKDMLVKVNDPSLDDRHLCHCPEWKDLSPTVSPVSFHEAVERPILKDY